MAVQINVTGIEDGVDLQTIVGTLTFSGNYATGGDTLDWSTAVGAQSGTRIFVAQAPPQYVSIQGTTGDSYGWIIGTTLKNGLVKINTASATELGAGAYTGRITADLNIFFSATFPRLL